MKTQIEQTTERQNRPTQRVEHEATSDGLAAIRDIRPDTVYQRKLQGAMHAKTPNGLNPVQRKSTLEQGDKPNKTGLPDKLKSGIENLSGYRMDDVKVHYNSSKPAQLQAHAYAQGTDIHLGPGQAKHLPHEAWHVVQQKQGRVKPTTQLKGKVSVNDDTGLEKEADVMGARALMKGGRHQPVLAAKPVNGTVLQRQGRTDELLKKEGNDNQEICILKLVFAGSGNEYIYDDNDRKAEYEDYAIEGSTINMAKKEGVSGADKDNAPTVIRETYEIAGPGGAGTKGSVFSGYSPYGLLDKGSNRTNRKVSKIPQLVNQRIDYFKRAYDNPKIVVLIKGHSRGAVAAHKIAHIIKNHHEDIEVELVSYDPVPTSMFSKGWHKKVGEEGVLSESTVVYSTGSGWFGIFTPQRQMDAKRVIITSENHGANLGGYFVYDSKRLKGSNLNTLPEGCFVEIGKTEDDGTKEIALARIADEQSLNGHLKFLIWNNKNKADWNRTKYVREVALACIRRQNANPVG